MSEKGREKVKSLRPTKSSQNSRVQEYSVEQHTGRHFKQEPQTITINLYSGSFSPVDRPSEEKTSEPFLEVGRKTKQVARKRSPSPCRTDNQDLTNFTEAGYKTNKVLEKRPQSPATANKNLENHFPEFSLDLLSIPSQSISDELEGCKTMDMRNKDSDNNKNVNNGKIVSDLERKKLEAELKATEEIAKIQQSVIEKRLALELASLQDSVDYQHKLRAQNVAAQADLRAMEEIAQRKQAMIEKNLAQELTSMEYRENSVPSRSPPPTPSPRLIPAPLIKPGIFKSEPLYTSTCRATSDYMNVNPQVQEYRKINPLGMGTSMHPELRPPVRPMGSDVQDPRLLHPPPGPRYVPQMNDRFIDYTDQDSQKMKQDASGCLEKRPTLCGASVCSQPRPCPRVSSHSAYNPMFAAPYKNQSVWKAMIMKVKRKLKSQNKRPEGWD